MQEYPKPPQSERPSRQDLPEQPEPKRFSDEVFQRLLSDAWSDMPTPELFRKWGHLFKDERDFLNYVGRKYRNYEGSFQEELDEVYEESLADKYVRDHGTDFVIDESIEAFPQSDFKVEKIGKKGKERSIIRMSTSSLPLAEIGLSNVTTPWIDLTMYLLDKLESSKDSGSLLLLKRIVKGLIVWQRENGLKIKKDGSFFS